MLFGFGVGEGVCSGDVVGGSFDGGGLSILEEQLVKIVDALPDVLVGWRLLVACP